MDGRAFVPEVLSFGGCGAVGSWQLAGEDDARETRDGVALSVAKADSSVCCLACVPPIPVCLGLEWARCGSWNCTAWSTHKQFKCPSSSSQFSSRSLSSARL